MFGSQRPTSFDLRFRLGRIPVRVSIWFWITMALLGSFNLWLGPIGVAYLGVWVLCGFVSILVHELGHALAALACGAYPAVTLAEFGGFAAYDDEIASPWKRMGIAAAGPAAGFLLLGLVAGSDRWLPWKGTNEWSAVIYAFLFMQCLYWNLLNLLPIWPLDGGKILRELLVVFGVRNPDVPTHIVSMILAGALAAYGAATMLVPRQVRAAVPDWLWDFYRPGWLTVVWMGMFAADNFRQYQAARRRSVFRPYDFDDDDAPPWRR